MPNPASESLRDKKRPPGLYIANKGMPSSCFSGRGIFYFLFMTGLGQMNKKINRLPIHPAGNS
ncbi:hypothetical protein ACTHO5_04485 [Cytobacillus praedii]